MITNLIIKNKNADQYVYDVSLDGTVINALGNNVCSNTDGFNYAMPSEEELSNRKYIGKGLNRNTKEGKEYIGVYADVAEFNDLFMRGKMGLGLDEFAPSTINFSRKNYADLLEGNEIKYVGNTIKSKRMPLYIERFMEAGVKMLLNNSGGEFLNYYYDYIEKIYNYKIPLKEIASKGRIKKTIKEYKADLSVLTKAGRPKSRQVWYELCIDKNLTPDIGETIYYINTGDGKKKTSYKDVEKKTIKGKDGEPDTFTIINNCIMLDRKIVDSEDEHFCTDDIEYNAPKYIEQFNKRITPLLVCFSPEIRPQIIINKPDNKKYFTEEQSKLTSGYPNKIEDQDTYEQLMSMEDKEIEFWMSINETPPFCEEIGNNWDCIVTEYKNRLEKLKDAQVQEEIKQYDKIIDELSKEDVNEFIENVKIPKKLNEFLKIDINTMSFMSKIHNVKIGTIYDIVDKEFNNEIDE